MLQAYLDKWRDDPSIDLLFIDSSSEKSFCAGGDVKVLIKDCLDSGLPHTAPENADRVYEFFENEYHFIESLYNYPKPVICWGDGLVLGGGMGILQACSHRIVTERSILAMPEIKIGFFPDVVAAHFLNKLPGYLGLFLAITGYNVLGPDAVLFGLADYLIRSGDKNHLLTQLLATHKRVQIFDVLDQLTSDINNTDTPLYDNLKVIRAVIDPADLPTSLQKLRQLANNQEIEKGIRGALSNFLKGSPLSIALTWHYLRDSRNLSLAQCFRSDLAMAKLCFQGGDFTEGVRALLIDKDLSPHWRYTWDELNLTMNNKAGNNKVNVYKIIAEVISPSMGK
jgi:enoyl-CoA hydratase/carnithine racemase